MKACKIYLDMLALETFGCTYSELPMEFKIDMLHYEICIRPKE